jgi:hypothetical protein
MQVANSAEEAKELLTKTETKHVPGKEPFRRHVLPPHVMELLLQVMTENKTGSVRMCSSVAVCCGRQSGCTPADACRWQLAHLQITHAVLCVLLPKPFAQTANGITNH